MQANVLLGAAFIGAGVENTIMSSNVLDHWNKGYLELMMEAVKYAEYADSLVVVAHALIGGYPGVTEYEVQEEFGAWFVNQVQDDPDADIPDEFTCQVKLKQLVTDFFAQCEEDVTKIQLQQALDNVQ